MSAANLGNWPTPGERRGVHDKGRQKFPVYPLARVRIERKKLGEEVRSITARQGLDTRQSACRQFSSRAGKSSIPAPFAQISQCGRGLKSNFGGAPQRRISMFAAASCPTGTELCCKLGTVNMKSASFASRMEVSFVRPA